MFWYHRIIVNQSKRENGLLNSMHLGRKEVLNGKTRVNQYTHTFYLLLTNARCGHCKKLLPIFEELAETIEKQNLSIRLGKVDAIAETEISEEEGIDRFPTIR